MVRTRTEADDARTEDETTVVDIRTTDLSEFEDGEAIRVHYRDEPTEPSKCVTGRIETRYADRKALIVTDDDRRLIVDLRDVGEEGGLRDFDTSETIGRPMFAETAYHPEKDGEDLRRELLGDDVDGDDDEDPDDDTPECPECGSDDVKDGAAANPDDVFDFGCRECGTLWDEDDGEDATLVYENTIHGAHEKTGKEYTRTKTVRVGGEVFRREAGLTGFRSPDHDGVFFVLPDGTVEFDPHDTSRGKYEVGDNGSIEGRSDE